MYGFSMMDLSNKRGDVFVHKEEGRVSKYDIINIILPCVIYEFYIEKMRISYLLKLEKPGTMP